MDATLVTAQLGQGRSRSHLEEGLRLPPARRLVREHPRMPGHAARPGNAGSNTFTDHKEVLAAALGQVPARFRRKVMVRVDGAGASHDLIEHLLSLSSPRQESAVHLRLDHHRRRRGRHPPGPGGAWKPGTAQDGRAEEDKDVAEITA